MKLARGVFAAVAAALALLPGSAEGGTTAAAASSGEEIAFSSSRVTGAAEGWLLAPGKAPLDVTASPYADERLAGDPTGRTVAFWSARLGDWHVFLAAPDGTGARPVAGLDQRWDHPPTNLSFSPDGRWLLVPRVVGQFQAITPSQVWLVDVQQGTARRLPGACEGASWSPDGRVIACSYPAVLLDVAGDRLAKLAASPLLWSPRGLLATEEDWHTTIVNERGRVVQHVEGDALAWSGDGTRLALWRKGVLLVHWLDGRERVLARHLPSGVGWAAFTPDGRGLGYQSNGPTRLVDLRSRRVQRLPREGQWTADGRFAFLQYARSPGQETVSLMVGDRLGRHATEVGQFPVGSYPVFHWLADGSGLLWDSAAAPSSDIYSIQADGSGERRLTSDPRPELEPAWSPDGQRLAFITCEASADPGDGPRYTVWTADADATTRTAVSTTGGQTFDDHPVFAPDGDRLAVDSGDTIGHRSIDILGLDGSRTTAVGYSADTPAWSPDGATIAFVHEDYEIWGVPTDGGEEDQLARSDTGHEGPVRGLTWSPDGTQLAFVRSTGLYVVGLDDAPPRLVARIDGVDHPSFSPDGSRIAISAYADHVGLGGEPAERDIFVVGVDGSDLHAITSTPFSETSPSWRPTG